MSGMPGRSGRKAFVPTAEQRNSVKALAGLGIPQEKICQLVVNPQTGKPLNEKSLRKHFKREIATGEVELHMQVGNFIASTILGRAPPPGTVAIDNPHVRGSLAIFFARTRMGWKEPVVNRHEEHVDSAIEYPDAATLRQKILDKLQRIAQSKRVAPETEGPSPCPSGGESDAT
jgi:hypothetical protein